MAPRNDLAREVTVVNEFGLHARSAAKIARIAIGARSGVWTARGEERADATSTLEVLALACPKGTRLRFKIEDPADHSILDAFHETVRPSASCAATSASTAATSTFQSSIKRRLPNASSIVPP